MDKTMTEKLNHILKDYHGYLKKELPELEKLIFTIYKVHFFESGKDLEKVHRTYASLKANLESHIIKQERALFFAISDYEKEAEEGLLGEILEFIKTTKADEEELLGLLRAIRQYTNNFTLPESSCQTYENTYNRLEVLEANLFDHIKLENQVFDQLKP